MDKKGSEQITADHVLTDLFIQYTNFQEICAN